MSLAAGVVGADEHAARSAATRAATIGADGEVVTGAAGYGAAPPVFESASVSRSLMHPPLAGRGAVRRVGAGVVAVLVLLMSLAMTAPSALAREVIRVTVTPAAASVASADGDAAGTEGAVATVTLEPSVQVAPDDDVTWSLRNDTAVTVTVDLALRHLERQGQSEVVTTGPPVDIAFETNPIVLAPGATAALWVPRRAVQGDLTMGVALVASSESLNAELAGLVVDRRASPSEVTAVLERSEGRLTGRLDLTTDRAIVVDLRARLVAWPNRVVTDRTVTDVVVLPPGRSLDLDLAGTAFVGPVDLDVVAGTAADGVSATARAWIVNRTAIRTAGTLVLVVTVLVLGAALLRRRRA